MPPLEGELVIRVESGAGRVRAASARSERPRLAARLFRGRPAREAAPICRSLFSICGRSQAIAAQGAVEAIRGEEPARQLIRARRICAETLQEHAWRLFVDAPRLAGREPAIDIVAEERRALAELLDTDLEIDMGPVADRIREWSRRVLFGWEPGRFLALDGLEGFERWLKDAGTPGAALCGVLLAEEPGLGASAVALLPPADDGWIRAAVGPTLERDADYEDRPHVDGNARETGPLARVASHPLVAAATAAWGNGTGARLLARLVEFAVLVERLSSDLAPRHGAVRTRDGSAVGWVETARGLLMHAVALDDGHIADYRIVAPTEWNFHPDGAFTHGTLGLRGDGARLDARVRRIIASLDPCVGVRYEARHA